MGLTLRSGFEYLCYVLVVGGGAVAFVGDKASMPSLRDGALVVVMLGMVAFGLDMIVRRRAEISTRYSSDIGATFHVFRGWAAACWGIAIALFAAALVGIAVVKAARMTTVEAYFAARPGILVIVAGIIVAAFGAGSAGRATYRSKDVERPAARWGDRILGGCWFAVGVLIVAAGLLRTFAPSWLDNAKAAMLTRALSFLSN